MSFILLKQEILQKMQLAGPKSLLTSFKSRNVTVTPLTTDQHQQVREYMKKENTNIKHQFDIWHVGKNIRNLLPKPKTVNARTYIFGSKVLLITFGAVVPPAKVIVLS